MIIENTPAKELCFFCRLPIVGIFVQWNGAGKSIELHPACSKQLSKSLQRAFYTARNHAEKEKSE